MKRVAVVGGGIAGLATAHALLKQEDGLEVLVLEAGSRAGGNLRSERRDGFLCEAGANGFLDNAPETLRLVTGLGLESRLLPSDDRARRRFVYRDGRLHALPHGPGGLLASGLLSWRGKLRLAGEPFARPRPPGDETVHAFARRRLGREAAGVLVDAVVSGVFAGDAGGLSLRACFPELWRMEGEHGGLFRALLASSRAGRRPRARLTSFPEGVGELADALARALGPRLRTGARLRRLERTGECYVLVFGSGESLDADAVVLTGGAAASADAVAGLDAELARELRGIESAPLAVVGLGYDQADLARPLDGFGFLVPRGEGPRILGALWESSIFEGRAPAGRVLVRAMIGGAHDPDAVELDDAELSGAVRRDLAATMGLTARPVFERVIRHRLGIPQYGVGHLDRLARIEERLARLPGLHLGGNAFRGVSINACVAEAGPLAQRVLASAARAHRAA